MTMQRTFTAGGWLEGGTTLEALDPSDLPGTVGAFAQALAADLFRALDGARTAAPSRQPAPLKMRYRPLMAIERGSRVHLPTGGTHHHVPFGGRKQSSYGPHEEGRSAAGFYAAVKTSSFSSGPIV